MPITVPDGLAIDPEDIRASAAIKKDQGILRHLAGRVRAITAGVPQMAGEVAKAIEIDLTHR